MARPDGDEGGVTPSVVKMSDQAVRVVRNRFNDLSAEFRNGTDPLRRHYYDLRDAAGQFADDLDDGASRFLISWTDVFEVCGESAGLIAGNTNRMLVDLERIDTDSSTQIQL